MRLYSDIVRLRIGKAVRKNSVLRYAEIVEDVVKDGKRTTRLLKYLGPVRTEGDVERYRKMLALEKRRMSVEKADIRDLDILPHRNFGMIYSSSLISSPLTKVFDLMGKHRDIIFLSVVSRLVHPGSDLSLINFLDRSYYPSVSELKKDAIYEALDALMAKKNEIEMAIVKALKPDLKRVYYDLTSTYFEGKEKNDLVMFGYSRDKKRGKKQINIGLMMADGIPIHHQVFPGNTIDPKTLKPIHTDLRKKFHVGRVIFIGDRAFGRKPSLTYLDRNEYITAVYRWDQPYRNTLMSTVFGEEHYHKELELHAMEVKVKWNTKDLTSSEKKRTRKRRAIAVYSAEREKEDVADIEEKEKIVNEIISSGKKGTDLIKALGKLRTYTKNKGKEIDVSRIETVKKLAGRFMIVSDADLSVEEIVKGYKDLWKIERSFRTIKSFIEIRPVYHRKEERIEAHVFVAVLSFLMARLFENALNNTMTIARISETLSELEAIPVRTEAGTIFLRTEADKARTLMEKINIPYPNKMLGYVVT